MPRANRILLLVTQADWGGVQRFLIEFACELIKEGRTVLLAGGGEGELWKEARARGIPARQLRHMVREISPFEDLRAIQEVREVIDEFKPDAIHLNSAKMGVVGSIAAQRSKTKPFVVYRIGGWTFLEPLPKWKKWLYRTAERLTASYKDVIITVHPGDERVAREQTFAPRKKIVSVPNGIDLASFTSTLKPREEARAFFSVPENAFVYGTIANAYATKGLLPYLDALKLAMANDPDAYAVILGDGPEFEQLLAKRDALGLKNRVKLPGHVDGASTYLRGFDVFVLPSRKEGMPWTLLEAMGAHIPCIATDVGACRWMLRENGIEAGIIVPPEDYTALVRELRTLRENASLRTRNATAAYMEVERRFTWKATLQGNKNAIDDTI